MRTPPVALTALVFLLAPVLHAEDWTVNKAVYHNVHVIKVNPDTVSVTYDGGTGRLNLSDLNPELQAKFKDAAADAKAFAVVEKNADTDPIAHLVVTLSATHGMWVNGMSRICLLSKSASPEELVPKVLGIKSYKIVRIEQVHIEDSSLNPYTAVLVQTDHGEKIVLLNYLNSAAGWWSRVYDSGL